MLATLWKNQHSLTQRMRGKKNELKDERKNERKREKERRPSLYLYL
jgi:hypothetical protein